MTAKPPKQLDEIDKRILRCLLKNAKMPMAQLAERVGLSASPCWQRVHRLEESGYILGYTVKVDQALLGGTEIVFVDVQLAANDEASLNRFARDIQMIDEILDAYMTSGEYDFLLRVAVAGTKGYEDFLINKLSKIKHVRHTRTSFAIRTLKEGHTYLGGLD